MIYREWIQFTVLPGRYDLERFIILEYRPIVSVVVPSSSYRILKRDSQYTHVDVSRAREILGYEPKVTITE
jgi:nucleoside-diphosphate-sugar epimerase